MKPHRATPSAWPTRLALPLALSILLVACQGTAPATVPPNAPATGTTSKFWTHAQAPRADFNAATLAPLPSLDLTLDAGATVNPYRGRNEVVEAGRAIFHQACARCHGKDAEPTPEAPDLRRLNGTCRRIAAPEISRHCRDDVDAHFLDSVRQGKVRAGVVYMPSWEGVLTPQAIWAVRTYLESRPAPPPAVLPALQAGVPP